MSLYFIQLVGIFATFSHLFQEPLGTNFQTIYFFMVLSVISSSAILIFSSHQALNVFIDCIFFFCELDSLRHLSQLFAPETEKAPMLLLKGDVKVKIPK